MNNPTKSRSGEFLREIHHLCTGLRGIRRSEYSLGWIKGQAGQVEASNDAVDGLAISVICISKPENIGFAFMIDMYGSYFALGGTGLRKY